MKCPHCHTPELMPTMIEEYLPAMGCGTCHGGLVSLLYYRHWAETQKEPTDAQATRSARQHSPSRHSDLMPRSAASLRHLADSVAT